MLNIIIITQDDPFYIPIFFKELFKHNISGNFELKGVVIQLPLGKKSIRKLLSQMLNFYGFINFFVIGVKFVLLKSLNYIAVKIFKGKFFGAFSVEHVIRKNDIKILYLKDVNSPDSLQYLKTFNIDVIFSIAASQIFKKDILGLPSKGCFNIHTSKLPKNRGMMPNFWSLYNYDNEPVSAITIHKMNEKLDDGEILLQREFNLNPKESLDSLIRKTKKMSAQLFLEAMKILDRNVQNFRKNDSTQASYHTFPTKEDVKKFKAKGLKLR